jgi:hypothetical protein
MNERVFLQRGTGLFFLVQIILKQRTKEFFAVSAFPMASEPDPREPHYPQNTISRASISLQRPKLQRRNSEPSPVVKRKNSQLLPRVRDLGPRPDEKYFCPACGADGGREFDLCEKCKRLQEPTLTPAPAPTPVVFGHSKRLPRRTQPHIPTLVLLQQSQEDSDTAIQLPAASRSWSELPGL